MITAKKGEAVYLVMNLAEGDEGLYPQAEIYEAGTSTKVTTVSLTHRAKGVYDGTWTPAATGYFTALFITYIDAGHTVEYIVYGRATEQISVITSKTDDLAALLSRALGLLHENAYIDNTVYSGGNLTSARVRTFSSKAAAEAATDGGSETSGLIATYTITSDVEAAGAMKTYRMVKNA